jgi:catechol 2,3-dioxygenase-like lactoylglutathione lyase family enzyme
LGTTAANIVTGVDFVAIATQDFDRACDFYANDLGLPQTARYGQMPGAEYEAGNLTLAVMQSDAFGMSFVANTHPIALQVDDVAAARGVLEEHGVRFGATIDSGVCHMAPFHDPDGNALLLHHRYAPRGA